MPVSELNLSDQTFSAQGLDLVDPESLLADLNSWHGFPENLFDDYYFVRANEKLIRIVAPPLELPLAPALDRVGLDFLRIDMVVPRLTTAAAMTFARYAVQNVVDTDREQCDRYLCRKSIVLTPQQLDRCTDRGTVLLRHYGHGLGLGFLQSTRPEDETFSTVRSLYPKAFAADLDGTSAFGNPS